MPILRELVKAGEKFAVGVRRRILLPDEVVLGRASMQVAHRRPSNFLKVDGKTHEEALQDPLKMLALKAKGLFEKSGELWLPDPASYSLLDDPEVVWNVITNSGRDQLHLQGYGSSGLASNGFNYIALSNDATAPAATDTALTSEITSNGLSRAQGVYAHTNGTNTSTIDHTFTASGTQSCQKAALFNQAGPPVAGIMNHELLFTQRTLISGDTIEITYTITLG